MAAIRILTLFAVATVLLTCYATAMPRTELGRLSGMSQFQRVNVSNGSQSTPAALGEIPHQVHVVADNGFNDQTCGGSIISDQWILTSARCMINRLTGAVLLPFAIRITAGSITKNRPLSVGAVVHKLAKVVLHPLHSTLRLDSDVDLALLKIRGVFKFTDNIQPVKLAETDTVPTGKAVVSGWDDTPETVNGPGTDVLLKATVPIVPDDRCFGFNGKYKLCAGGEEGVGFCMGVSRGSPLTQDGSLVGVVSDSYCPGTYTRVSAARDWIKKEAGV